MPLNLSTTGTLTTVLINDLGALEFTHPVVKFDLEQSFSKEQLRDSTDLQAAIDAGYILLDDGSSPVANLAGNYQFMATAEKATLNETDEFSKTSLPAPVSTNSQIPQSLLIHSFTPQVAGKNWQLKFDLNYEIPAVGQRAEFTIEVNGVLYGAVYVKEGKDSKELYLVTYNIYLDNLPAALQVIEVFYRKQNGGALLTVNDITLSTKKLN